jgi:hypothetical protein
MTVRVVVQSVEGPYVLVELEPRGLAFLEQLQARIAADPDALGVVGYIVKPFAGLNVRFASGLTSAEVEGWKVLCDPVNEVGPNFLPRYRVTRVQVTEGGFWVYAVDDSDETHLAEVIRSDTVALRDLT